MNSVGQITTQKVGKLTFHFSETRVAVSTGVQFFVIQPKDKYSYTMYNTVSDKIRRRKVKNFADLFEGTQGKIIVKDIKQEWFYGTWK